MEYLLSLREIQTQKIIAQTLTLNTRNKYICEVSRANGGVNGATDLITMCQVF